MSQLKISAGERAVEVSDDNASATALLGVALAAWEATRPERGRPMGFGGGSGGGVERDTTARGVVRFRQRPAHVNSGEGGSE
ncbi:MAG: hypothetical protein ACRDQ7_15680 [Haloechinothrix sp.]